MKGQLTLVGAGPGAIDLITLRALQVLKLADFILYDALANEDLLEHTRPDAQTIFVGKRAGEPSYTQDEINDMIVDLALQGGGAHVVRLKGGDPFVFGRGYEELKYARDHGLKTEVVPGISSAFALPALLGMPVTSRDVSRSVHLVTATGKEGQIAPELDDHLNGEGTLIVFMGFRMLSRIVARYKERSLGGLPIMVIQKGSTDEQEVVVGCVDSILEVVKNKQLGTPALIVAGNVVKLHPAYNPTNTEHHAIV